MALRAALQAFQDIALVQQNWGGFINALVVAHEADLEEAKMRVKASVTGLTAKDMKPGLFENAQVTKQPFGQWSNDFYGWARRVNES